MLSVVERQRICDVSLVRGKVCEGSQEETHFLPARC
jgi:hypothetical protein